MGSPSGPAPVNPAAVQPGNNDAPQLPTGEFVAIVGNNAYQARRSSDGSEEYRKADGSWTDFPHINEAETIDASKTKVQPHVVNLGDNGVFSVTYDSDGTPHTKNVVPPNWDRLGVKDALSQERVGQVAAQTALAQSAKANGDKRADAYVRAAAETARHNGVSEGQGAERLKIAWAKLNDSLNSPLNAARTTKANASARLDMSKADVIAAPIFSKFSGEVERLQELRDKGIITQQDFDLNVKSLHDTAVQEAKQGMTMKDAATLDENRFRDEVTQSDSHAATAGSIYDNTGKDIFDEMAKYGVGGDAMFAGALKERLAGAPGFQSDMGGAPAKYNGFVGNLGGGGTPAPVSSPPLGVNAGVAPGGTAPPTDPGRTWDPNTNTTTDAGQSSWDGAKWVGGNPTPGAMPGTAPTSPTAAGGPAGGAPAGAGGFLNPSNGMKILMDVFQKAQQSGEHPDKFAQEYLDQMKNAGIGA